MFFSGDICVSVTAALPQYAKEAPVDRSHPGSHILSGSWEMPECFLTVGQLSIKYASVTALSPSETTCARTHDCKKPRSCFNHSCSALSNSDVPGRIIYSRTRADSVFQDHSTLCFIVTALD